ncbi:MAG: hypothetical protein ABIE47_11360, partial [Pseudomonadota bacterium]
EIAKAIEWDGSNAEYWYKLGSADYTDPPAIARHERAGYTDEKRKEKERIVGWLDEWMKKQVGRRSPRLNPLEGASDEAIQLGKEKKIGNNLRNLWMVALERSVELNPFEAQYHLQLGWAYARKWKEPDYHDRWLPAADISMDRAAYFAGVKNPHLHQELGNYWTMRSKSVYPNNPLHHEAWAKACWHYQKAQRIEDSGQWSVVSGQDKKHERKRPESKALKRMKKEIRDYVWNVYPDEEYVAQVLDVTQVR